MALNDSVTEDELDHVHRVLVTLDVVLDVHGAELLRRREVFDLAVVDSLHQCGLTATVRTAETVTLTLLHVESGVVEQNERTVRQGEVTLAKIFTLFVLDDEDLLGRFVHLLGTLDEGLGHRLSLTEEELQVRGGARLGPGVQVEVLGQQGVGRQGANVVKVHLDAFSLHEGGDVLLGGTRGFHQEVDELFANRLFVVDTLAFLATFLGTGFVTRGLKQSLVRARAHLTALRIGDFIHGALQERQELGEERRGIHRIFDELAHVVDDDGSLTLDRGALLEEQTALEKRTHDGERRGFDLLDKGRRRELVDALRHFIDIVDALDQSRDERLDVEVTDARGNLGHGFGGRLLDFVAHVHHDLRELRDDFRQVGRHRLAVALDEAIENAQSRHGGLPELRLETNKDRLERRANRKLGELRLNRRDGGVTSRAHVGRLVITREVNRNFKQIDQVRLFGEGRRVREFGNLVRRRLARVLILLLLRLLPQRVDVGDANLRRRGHVALARRHVLRSLCVSRDTQRARQSLVPLPRRQSRLRALDPFPPSFSSPPPWINSTRRLSPRASSARRESNRNESKRIRAHFFRSPASSRPPPSPPRARSIGRADVIRPPMRRGLERSISRASHRDVARVHAAPPPRARKKYIYAPPPPRASRTHPFANTTRVLARASESAARARAGAAAFSKRGGTRSRVTTGRLRPRAVYRGRARAVAIDRRTG